MNWTGWTDFIAMGGYGLYVWGSFGMAAACLVGEWLSLGWRRAALRQQQADEAFVLDGLPREA